MAAGGASFATGQVFTVAPGRSFYFSGAAASPALWQPLRGEGVVPPRLRSLPVADHASLLPIAGYGMKKAAAVSLLRIIILRCAWMRICFAAVGAFACHRPRFHRCRRCGSVW